METPFKPNLTGPQDLRYFDPSFTGMDTDMSVAGKTMNTAQKAANKFPDFTFQEPGL